MDITQVKIFPVEEEKLKAFVSIVFDHCFMINDVKVIEGTDGLFLSMPSRRKRNGEFKDVAHPLNSETRRRIELEVLEEYRQMVDDPTPRRPVRKPSSEESEDVVKEEAKDEAKDQAKDGVAPSPSAPKEPSPAPQASRKPEGAEETSEPESGAEEAEGDEAESPDSLGEVQEKHLRDSFWQVT